MHTTNYTNTFIEVAEDCPVTNAEVPPLKGEKPTVASLLFDLVAAAPYQYTSDDLIFSVHAGRAGISADKQAAEREQYFSRGQACLRSSALAKRYGWGFHHDESGRVAIYGLDSKEYQRLAADPSLKHVRAMRSKKA